MNEDLIAGKIKQNLDLGLGQIGEQTLARLEHAREQALSHFHEAKPELDLAWAGSRDQRFQPGKSRLRYWVPAAALILALTAGVYWRFSAQGPDADDVDAGLLSEDVPINALIDHRFDGWLKGSSEE